MINFKTKFYIGLIVIGLISIFFCQRGCSATSKGNVTKQSVVIPEKSGELKTPTVVIKNKGVKDSIIYRNVIIKTENPFNKKLAKDFIASQKENDSLKTLKLYLDAIQEKDGTYVFDNNDIKLDIKIKTRGEVLKVTPTYTIKEQQQKVEVKNKETVFAIYLGGSIETTTTLDRLTPKVNIGIQNKRGDILSVQYGVDKSIGVGYNLRIINIKK